MREETRQDIISAEEMGTKYDEAAKEIWKNTSGKTFKHE